MIQDILSAFGGVDRFGVLSLCLFCSVFVGVVIWTLLQKKNYVDMMASAPLDSESESKEEGTNCHE